MRIHGKGSSFKVAALPHRTTAPTLFITALPRLALPNLFFIASNVAKAAGHTATFFKVN
jgi:hypothetical protein